MIANNREQMTRRRLFAGAAAGGMAAAGAPTAPGTNIQGQQITFLHWWTTDIIGPGTNESMEWAAARFKERTGATVEYATGRAGGGLNEKLLTMIAAGTSPDASFCSVVFGRDNYDAGVLKNLRPYVAKAPDLADAEFFESSTLFRTKGPDVFGIPVMGPESLFFTINSQVFSAAGLDPKGGDVKTWEDLATVAQKLTKASGDDFQRIGLFVTGLGLDWLTAWLYTNGSRPTNPEETRYLLDAPATREAVQYTYDLIHRHRVSPKLDAPNRPANASDALLTGQLAMMYGTGIAAARRTPGASVWVIPLPKGPRGKGAASATWTNFCAVPREARNPDGGVEWIRYFTSLETHIGRSKMSSGTGQVGLGPRVKLYNTPEWAEAVKEMPPMAQLPEIARLPGPYPYLRYNALAAEIHPIFRDILLAKVGVNEGLAQAQQIADRIIKEPLRLQ